MPEIRIGHIEIPNEVRVCLKWMHKHAKEPEGQSVRGGTQVNLSRSDLKVIREFLRRLKQAIGFLLPDPFEFEGVWSIGLKAGGRHVPHNHPKGWMSGVCYIEIPDASSGLLQLGLTMEKVIKPRAGNIVLFPSWLPHGTTLYQGSTPRLSVAFDLRKTDATAIPMVG